MAYGKSLTQAAIQPPGGKFLWNSVGGARMLADTAQALARRRARDMSVAGQRKKAKAEAFERRCRVLESMGRDAEEAPRGPRFTCEHYDLARAEGFRRRIARQKSWKRKLWGTGKATPTAAQRFRLRGSVRDEERRYLARQS